MARRSLAGVAADVASGSEPCEERAAAALERIAREDGRIHAYLAVSGAAAEEARRVDAGIRAGGRPGRLAGAIISVKDNICAAGMPMTCASRMLEGYEPPFDATAVARLRAEGAVIIGKTNMDEFAMGVTTEFSAFGPTRNPRGPDYVPGGSSGGSAAAVAAGTCDASLGSDTGGSVRNPASFCGVAGYKPTYGLVSRYGLVPYANSIEQIGPIAPTVADAALVLDVIAGRDERDCTSSGAPGGLAGACAAGAAGAEGLRVGLAADPAGGAAPEAAAAARHAASALEAAGASCEDVALGTAGHSVAAYYAITSVEAASNLARYDGIMYGAGPGEGGLEMNAHAARSRRALGPEVVRRMVLGGYAASAGRAGQYYGRALRVRDMLAAELDAAFAGIDVLLSPTVPYLPFRLGEKIGDPVALFAADACTVEANLTGRPAVSVPFESRGGLPVGVQLTGGAGGDAALLRAAAALEAAAPAREGA